MSTDVTPRRPTELRRPLQPLRLWWMAALALSGFTAHAALIQTGCWQGLDARIMWALHDLGSAGLDRFFLLVTAIGHQWGVIPVDVLLVLVLAAARRWRCSAFVLLATAGSGLLNRAVKALFSRERPQLWPHPVDETSWSFPSGHAMGSWTLMLVLIVLAWPGRWRYPVLLLASGFALLVGISRPYLGVHWPSDIVGGWLLASAWVFAVSAYMSRQQWGELCRRTDIS